MAMRTETQNEKIRDWAYRLIHFTYEMDNAEKSDINDIELTKDELIQEGRKLLE